MLTPFQKFRHSLWMNYHGFSLNQVLDHYQAFQDSQKRSLNENLDLQWQQVCRLLRHSYEQVPYYRELFDKNGVTPSTIKTVEDFQKIPLLTKEIIQNQGESLIARNFRGTPMIRAASGGSTGQVVRLFKDPTNKAIEMASTWGYHKWIGWNAGDRAMRLWGSLDPVTVKRKLYRIGSKYCINDLRFNVHGMEKQVMREIEDCLNKFRPKILIGYSNAIYAFAKYLKDQNRTCFGPIGIVPTAEMLFSSQRKLMEQVFGCPVFNRYASQEIGQLAGECQEGNFHLNIPYVFFEFLRNGVPVSNGEPGSVVVTDLSNYAMPFIRYQIGDIAVPDSHPCPCGKSLPLVRDLKGRLSDVIVTPDQKFIFADDIAEIFYPMVQIRQFQVIQTQIKALTVKLVKKKGVGSEINNYIRSSIQKAVGANIEVTLQVVDDIPLLSSGKHRICISEISHDGRFENFE